MHFHTKLASSAGAVLAAGALALSAFAGSPAGASQHHVARPHPASRSARPLSPTGLAVNDQFQNGTGGWCNYAAGCDGAGSDYGTIDSVTAGFSGGGTQNYAGSGSVPALAGTRYAVVTGSNNVDEGQGCPQPGVTEYCSGPYYLPEGGTDFSFPHKGFTVTDDLYLDTAAAGTGEIDVDTALQGSGSTPFGDGGPGVDNTVAFCSDSGAFQVAFGHGSPVGCSGAAQITASGWYRVVLEFSNVAGYGYLTMSVYAENGAATTGETPVATSGPQPVEFSGATSAEPVSALGGPAYTWLPTLQASGFVPMGNYAIQTGQHLVGNTP
jgi:hypothetical protein